MTRPYDPSLCPDEETLAAFAAGTLDVRSVEAAEEHLARCAPCRWKAGGDVPDVAGGGAVSGSALARAVSARIVACDGPGFPRLPLSPCWRGAAAAALVAAAAG